MTKSESNQHAWLEHDFSVGFRLNLMKIIIIKKSLPNTLSKITLNVCCHNLCQYICTFPENMTYSLSEGITI